MQQGTSLPNLRAIWDGTISSFLESPTGDIGASGLQVRTESRGT
jgi:hypothetical protein